MQASNQLGTGLRSSVAHKPDDELLWKAFPRVHHDHLKLLGQILRRSFHALLPLFVVFHFGLEDTQ